MTCDMHTHTICSFDGQYSVHEMCDAAHKRGISVIALTDHCDFRDNAQGWHMYLRREKARNEGIKNARRDYPDMEILCGIELGNPDYNPDDAREFLASRRFDFVLGSVHFVKNQLDIYYFRPHSEKETDEMFESYFDEIEAVIRFSDFDSLAHIDYPLRCLGENTDITSLSRYEERVDAVLRMAAAEGKALEINTKTFSGKEHRVSPEKWVLERFKSHGGRRITVGSDAHAPEYIGSGFNAAVQLAESCGFSEFTVYKDRRPVSFAFNSAEKA